MMQRFGFTCFWSLALLLTGCGLGHQVKFAQLKPLPYNETALWGSVDYDTAAHRTQLRYFFENKPYTGDVIDYYPGLNVIRFKGSMENGFATGAWTYYFSDGKVKMQGRYLAGSPDSIWQKYYPDRRPRVTELYKLFVDTLYCDTLGLWYKGGRPYKTVSGDTFITYYPNGRYAEYTIGRPVKRQWRYTGGCLKSEQPLLFCTQVVEKVI